MRAGIATRILPKVGVHASQPGGPCDHLVENPRSLCDAGDHRVGVVPSSSFQAGTDSPRSELPAAPDHRRFALTRSGVVIGFPIDPVGPQFCNRAVVTVPYGICASTRAASEEHRRGRRGVEGRWARRVYGTTRDPAHMTKKKRPRPAKPSNLRVGFPLVLRHVQRMRYAAVPQAAIASRIAAIQARAMTTLASRIVSR